MIDSQLHIPPRRWNRDGGFIPSMPLLFGVVRIQVPIPGLWMENISIEGQRISRVYCQWLWLRWKRGEEMGARVLNWELNGWAVVNQCFRNVWLCPVCRESLKFQKLRKSTSSLFFFTIRILTLLMFLDSASSRLAFIFRFDLRARYLWPGTGPLVSWGHFLRLSTDLSQSLCMPLRLPSGLPHKY